MTFTTRRIREESTFTKTFLRSSPEKKAKVAAVKRALLKSTPFFVRLGAMGVGLYGKWKRRKEEEVTTSRRMRLLKKCLVLLVAALLGVLLIAGTVRALVSLKVLTIHSFLSVAGSPLPEDTHGFTNILLLGAGDKDHDGVDLTDSIMIVSLDPWKTKSALMLSIPRDLYVLSTEKMGKGRINELYRNHKNFLRQSEKMSADIASQISLQELAAEIGRKMGITIHHVVKVDFTAFVDTVDTLGGLDIDVPYDIVDTQYPGPNYSYQTFEIRKGLQHLDGEAALKYARSRHTTSDFGRSKRQQQLLQALAEKAKSEGIAKSAGKISALLKILSDHVVTTMTFGEILGAAKLADNIDRQNIISENLNIETGYGTPFVSPGGLLYAPPRDQFDGASVLLPISIPESPVTWKQIQIFVQMLFQNRALILSRPKITVLNAGAPTGMGRSLANELIRNGFEDVESANASDDRSNPPKLPTSVVTPRTEADASRAQFFSTLLHLPTGPLPAGIDPAKQGSGSVTIVLGTDYDFVLLQDLLPPQE